MNLSRIATAAGRFQHLRGKGAFWVELVRTWIMPAAAVGAYVLYLGQPKWVSVVAAVVAPVLIEVVGTLIARFLYHHGGQAADYQMAYDTDPWKKDTVAELRHIARTLDTRLPADP